MKLETATDGQLLVDPTCLCHTPLQTRPNEDNSKSYQRWRLDMKEEWETIYDYLFYTKFGIEWIWIDAPTQSDKGDQTINLKPKHLLNDLDRFHQCSYIRGT